MPKLPDELTQALVNKHGLSVEDARTLVVLDDGARLDLFHATMSSVAAAMPITADVDPLGRIVANWSAYKLSASVKLISQGTTRTRWPSQPERDIPGRFWSGCKASWSYHLESPAKSHHRPFSQTALSHDRQGRASRCRSHD